MADQPIPAGSSQHDVARSRRAAERFDPSPIAVSEQRLHADTLELEAHRSAAAESADQQTCTDLHGPISTHLDYGGPGGEPSRLG
jgi:hypothetical protein